MSAPTPEPTPGTTAAWDQAHAGYRRLVASMTTEAREAIAHAGPVGAAMAVAGELLDGAEWPRETLAALLAVALVELAATPEGLR